MKSLFFVMKYQLYKWKGTYFEIIKQQQTALSLTKTNSNISPKSKTINKKKKKKTYSQNNKQQQLNLKNPLNTSKTTIPPPH